MFQHVNHDNYGSWTPYIKVNWPKTNHEILDLQPNSFYEVDLIARNDIGPSASQTFRIRTLASLPG